MGTIQHKSVALTLGAMALALVISLHEPRAAQAGQPADSGAQMDWSAYNGGVDGDHYSPLAQITPANVAGLASLITPLVGVGFAWALLGEHPDAAESAGILLMVAALFGVLRPRVAAT